jgi:hypothetical protein
VVVMICEFAHVVGTVVGLVRNRAPRRWRDDGVGLDSSILGSISSARMP